MGTKSRRTKSINDLFNELKERDRQERLTSGLFPSELHGILGQYQSGSLVPINTISQRQVANQCKNKQRKGDDPKSEDKDNITGGTSGAHVEDTTTNKNTTAPSGGDSLGAHVSETSQATSRPSRTVEEILKTHPIDDTFWDKTKSADVSVDTVNSEKQMGGSHITEFNTYKDEQSVLSDLLSQEDQDFDNRHN